MVQSSESSTEILFPKHITLPTITTAEYSAKDAPAGTLFISGNKILLSTGTDWETVTSA